MGLTADILCIRIPCGERSRGRASSSCGREGKRPVVQETISSYSISMRTFRLRTHNKVCCVRLELMNGLQLVEPSLGPGQAQVCGLLHQAELSVQVGRLFCVGEGVPARGCQFMQCWLRNSLRGSKFYHALRFAGLVHGSALATAQIETIRRTNR